MFKLYINLNIQRFAHKKGQSSTDNGRDSAGRRLGAKLADGEKAKAGAIIYRQRGTKIFPGSLVNGIVKYERSGKTRKKVSVYEAN